MDPVFAVLVTVVLGAVVVVFSVRLASLQRDLSDAQDQLRDMRKTYWDLYMDSHAAFRAAGLTKTPRKDPEWVKAGDAE